MNYITTNIRFPEDVYMDLKMEAAKRRTSVAAIVRERVEKKSTPKNNNVEKFMKRLEKIAKENAKYFNGKNATQIIREMRDEQ